MSELVFKYPGGKTQMFSWIESFIKTHRTWVDVFGGSGVVTANKDPSKVEVYNDLDGDIVHFFTTLRDNRAELQEWLRATPHSRELHTKYAREFFDGERPTDDVERAGRFFYLRFTQFACKYNGISGYNGSTKRSAADSLNSATERLTQWQRRFSSVQIEQVDFETLIDRYDTPQTLFYADPPYMDEGDVLYSHEGGFEHGRFVDTLLDTEGDWLVSYTRVPEPLREAATCIVEQDRLVRMSQGQHESKRNTERLVMSYDPERVPMHSEEAQSTIGGWSE
jgi:DNA adenine methylase